MNQDISNEFKFSTKIWCDKFRFSSTLTWKLSIEINLAALCILAKNLSKFEASQGMDTPDSVLVGKILRSSQRYELNSLAILIF